MTEPVSTSRVCEAEELAKRLDDDARYLLNANHRISAQTCLEAASFLRSLRSESVPTTKPDVNTPEGHKARHVELHHALDELFADYIDHHPGEHEFTSMPLRQLLQWSYEQTTNPSEKRHE